jgi:hypothetical protein
MQSVVNVCSASVCQKYMSWLVYSDCQASYYLDARPLVDITCRAIADTIKGKSPEEIRTAFGIVNDFLPQEEELMRRSVLERTMLLPTDQGMCLLLHKLATNFIFMLHSKLKH